MSTKKLILKLVASVALAFAFVIPFLANIFIQVTGTTSTSVEVAQYGIFADYSNLSLAYSGVGGSLQTIWMTLNSIFVIIVAVMALVYIILFILELCKVKFAVKLSKNTSVLAIVILIVTVLMALFGTLATLLNHYEYGILTKAYFEIAGGTGFLLQLAPLVGAIFAVLASIGKKGKK